jgi:hypothetical protein
MPNARPISQDGIRMENTVTAEDAQGQFSLPLQVWDVNGQKSSLNGILNRQSI